MILRGNFGSSHMTVARRSAVLLVKRCVPGYGGGRIVAPPNRDAVGAARPRVKRVSSGAPAPISKAGVAGGPVAQDVDRADDKSNWSVRIAYPLRKPPVPETPGEQTTAPPGTPKGEGTTSAGTQAEEQPTSLLDSFRPLQCAAKRVRLGAAQGGCRSGVLDLQAPAVAEVHGGGPVDAVGSGGGLDAFEPMAPAAAPGSARGVRGMRRVVHRGRGGGGALGEQAQAIIVGIHGAVASWSDKLRAAVRPHVRPVGRTQGMLFASKVVSWLTKLSTRTVDNTVRRVAKNGLGPRPMKRKRGTLKNATRGPALRPRAAKRQAVAREEAAGEDACRGLGGELSFSRAA